MTWAQARQRAWAREPERPVWAWRLRRRRGRCHHRRRLLLRSAGARGCRGRRGHGLRVRRYRSPCRWRMLLMLRSRRATPIQDIVDGTTTEDRTDCRQNHRLCVGATEHLDSKGRARGERNRELGAVVGRGAGVEQQACVGSLTSLDALDDLGPFALELAGVLDRGGLGSTGGGNLSGVVGLGHRHGRCSRHGSRSRNGLRCRRYRLGRGSRSRGLGCRAGQPEQQRRGPKACRPDART